MRMYVCICICIYARNDINLQTVIKSSYNHFYSYLPTCYESREVNVHPTIPNGRIFCCPFGGGKLMNILHYLILLLRIKRE